MSRGAAAAVLSKAGLGVGRIHLVESDKRDKVLVQDKPAGSEVPKGTRIGLTVGFKLKK
jgi:hypothetical protein